MGPTRIRVLAVVALAAAAIAWTLLRVWYTQGGGLPVVPWTVPPALALLAVLVVALAANLRRRLRGDPRVRPFQPLAAARLVALAKASAYAGALLTGLYGGLAVVVAGELDVLATSRLVVALLSVAASAGVAVAGLILERTCRVKPPEDEQPLPSG